MFKIDTSGRVFVLHSFAGGADGGKPHSGMTLDSAGNLYGTTGDLGNPGTVFKVDALGNETVLYNFSSGSGGTPKGVIVDPAGNIYGTTSNGFAGGDGVYKLSKSGHLTVLHSFTGLGDGASPGAGVTIDAAGNLYGTTYSGGTFYYGTVYKVDPAGNETVLYSFAGHADGGYPEADGQRTAYAR